MDTGKLATMVEVFEGLEDWRSAQQTRHRLSELAHGGRMRRAVRRRRLRGHLTQWGRVRLDRLRSFLKLDYGVASPDTFERVFALLDRHQFERVFRNWVGTLTPALAPEQVIAIDGKTSRRTTTKAAAAPLHLVSALAADVGLVLGQSATAEKSNEITAIPELLRTLDVTVHRDDRRDGRPDGHCPADSRAGRTLRAVRQGQPAQAVRVDPARTRQHG